MSKKEFDEQKKKGAPKVVPKRPIPYNIIKQRFDAIVKLRGDLNKERNDLIGKLNACDKQAFECDAQMRVLSEMMSAQPKAKLEAKPKP